MRKADKMKLLYIASISLLAFIVGCVDTSVQPIPNSVDFRSQVSVVNLTTGSTNADVSMYSVDNPTTAVISTSIAFGQASSYFDIPAGIKKLGVKYTGFTPAKDTTFQLTTESMYRMRIFLVGDGTGNGVGVQKAAQSYISSMDNGSSIPVGSTEIRLFNGSPDAGSVTSMKVKGGTVDTSIAVSAAYMAGTKYFQISAGTYNVTLVAGSDTLTTFSTNQMSSQKRYTAFIYDLKASLKSNILSDD